MHGFTRGCASLLSDMLLYRSLNIEIDRDLSDLLSPASSKDVDSVDVVLFSRNVCMWFTVLYMTVLSLGFLHRIRSLVNWFAAASYACFLSCIALLQRLICCVSVSGLRGSHMCGSGLHFWCRFIGVVTFSLGAHLRIGAALQPCPANALFCCGDLC